MQLIAFITEPAPIKAILDHLDLPVQPPPVAAARGAPQKDFEVDQYPPGDTTAPEPVPEYPFDQTVS